jgi:hypothetical protein
VSQFQEASVAERYRNQIERTIDEMIAGGKSEQEILAAIRHEYRPYDSMPEFDEGFTAYQTNGALRRHPYDDAPAGETPIEACRRGVAGQAYNRGANAAMWLWQAQQRMKPTAK